MNYQHSPFLSAGRERGSGPVKMSVAELGTIISLIVRKFNNFNIKTFYLLQE